MKIIPALFAALAAMPLFAQQVQESPLGPVISVPTRFLNSTDAAIPLEGDYEWGRLEVTVDRLNMQVTATRM